MAKLNIKGLGKNQVHILKRMIKESLVIRILFDTSDVEDKPEFVLQDWAGNDWLEKIPNRLVKSLFDRKIIENYDWHPSVHIMVRTFTLKRLARKLLTKNKFYEQSN